MVANDAAPRFPPGGSSAHYDDEFKQWMQSSLRAESTAAMALLRQEIADLLNAHQREMLAAVMSGQSDGDRKHTEILHEHHDGYIMETLNTLNRGAKFAVSGASHNGHAEAHSGDAAAHRHHELGVESWLQPFPEGGDDLTADGALCPSNALDTVNPSGSPISDLVGGWSSQIAEPGELRPKAVHKSVVCGQDLVAKSVPSDKSVYKSAVFKDLVNQSPNVDYGFLEKIVRSQLFEYSSAFVIVACTITMTIEIQYAGLQSGWQLGVNNYPNQASVTWPGAAVTFKVLEPAYNTIFLTELVLRLVVDKRNALRSAWIWFDIVLVSMGWLDWLGLLKALPLNPMILRVARLARMIRILKVLKQVRAFETLFLLIRSIQASVGALVWSFLLLWTVQIAMAILFCQLLREFIDDETEDEKSRILVFNYFGTFSNAVLTMFEITLANWVVSCRVLYVHVNEWYGVIYIMYRGCFMFAVLKVITAVFIAETTRSVNSDVEMAVVKSKKDKESTIKKIVAVFDELDCNTNGELGRGEFNRLFVDPILQQWLGTLDIDTTDMHEFWEVMADNQGEDGEKVTKEMFVKGLVRLKGPAKSLDVLQIRGMAKRIQEDFRSLEKSQKDLARRCTSSLALESQGQIRQVSQVGTSSLPQESQGQSRQISQGRAISRRDTPKTAEQCQAVAGANVPAALPTSATSL